MSRKGENLLETEEVLDQRRKREDWHRQRQRNPESTPEIRDHGAMVMPGMRVPRMVVHHVAVRRRRMGHLLMIHFSLHGRAPHGRQIATATVGWIHPSRADGHRTSAGDLLYQ